PAIFTLSLHDALPISDGPPLGSRELGRLQARALSRPGRRGPSSGVAPRAAAERPPGQVVRRVAARKPAFHAPLPLPEAGRAFLPDRKSTRLNSSHDQI